MFALPPWLSAVLDTQQNSWNTAGSLKHHLASKIVCIQISSIWRQKKMGIFKFLYSEQLNSGLSVTIMQFNQVFCSIWQYFSQQEIFFSRLSSFCFLNSELHLAYVCVGIMLQATARWEAFFSQTFPSESPCHYLGEMSCYAFYYNYLPSPAWRPSNDLIAPSGLCPCPLDYVLEVDLFDSISTWRILADN